MTKKRSSSIAALAVATLAVTACGSGGGDGAEAEDKEYALKLASYQPPGAAEPAATQKWAEQVKEATDGQVEIEYIFQEGLLPGAEILQGVGDGRADLGYVADAYYPGELPLTNIAGLPFITSDAQAQGATFAELYENNEDFRAEWEDQGVHVLMWAPVPPNAVALEAKAETLDDLQGRKIRQIGFSAEAFQQAGITPVAISHSEVYEALQRGVIDGVSGGSLDILTDRDYQEIAPNFIDLRSGNYATTAIIINKELWDGLPADVKQAMTDAAAEYPESYFDILAQREDAACEELKEADGTITIIDEAEAEEWAAEVSPTIKEAWMSNVKQANPDVDANAFYDDYVASIEKNEAESNYTPALQRCAAG